MFMRWIRYMVAVLWLLAECSVLAGGYQGQRGDGAPQLVFSVKAWEGDYASKDVAGGVETTPIVGAIYTIKADGTDLNKIVALGKKTDFPCYSPDGRSIYFQSNSTAHA